MKLSKLLACSGLIFFAVSGLGFASQGSVNAELEQVMSAHHKYVFANECQEEDKVNGVCPHK